MSDELRKLLMSAKLLYQNAEGCCVNHHTSDFERYGLPAWLRDCKHDIDAANARLHIEGALARPAGDVEVGERWQPIETAPKDGTNIFVAGINDMGNWFMADAKWNDGAWCLFDPVDDAHTVETDVSHWQPLPKPPAVPRSVQSSISQEPKP